MTADQLDPIINIPFLHEFGNHRLFMLEVIHSMRQAIYLPGDYIAHRVFYCYPFIIFSILLEENVT